MRAMAKSTDTAARCKAIVKALHDGAGRGSIARLAEHLSDDFELFLPAFLPWGGIFGKARFLALLDHLPDVLDFARLDYLGMAAEGGHVGVPIEIGIAGTTSTTMIFEHWDFVDARAVRLRIAFYDPGLLVAQLANAPNCF